MSKAAETLRAAIAEAGLEFEEPAPGEFVVSLPGDRKLKTTCSLVVGAHSLSINAFVARAPDENHEAVYRWLLQRNIRLYAVAFSVDHLGDIYLSGRMPLHAITVEEVDRVLGSVLQYADTAFNTILELGFASSIRKEWVWRRLRGESTRNLEAFQHLDPGPADDSAAGPA